jgi:hypothetical protein
MEKGSWILARGGQGQDDEEELVGPAHHPHPGLASLQYWTAGNVWAPFPGSHLVPLTELSCWFIVIHFYAQPGSLPFRICQLYYISKYKRKDKSH